MRQITCRVELIAEKQSLVIGGFHVADEVDNLNKVPLLGNIPLLGKLLFSSSQITKSRRERLFFGDNGLGTDLAFSNIRR